MIAARDLNTNARQPHSGTEDPHAPAVKRADISGQQSPRNPDDARRRTENRKRHEHGERTQH